MLVPDRIAAMLTTGCCWQSKGLGGEVGALDRGHCEFAYPSAASWLAWLALRVGITNSALMLDAPVRGGVVLVSQLCLSMQLKHHIFTLGCEGFQP